MAKRTASLAALRTVHDLIAMIDMTALPVRGLPAACLASFGISRSLGAGRLARASSSSTENQQVSRLIRLKSQLVFSVGSQARDAALSE